jgi:ABC-type Na+ efflux pump permease subunit
MQASLRRYRLLEARYSLGWATPIGVFLGVLMVVICNVLVPLLPATAIGLLERAMLLRGVGAVTLVNDYMGVYFISYFIGVSGLLRALVEPREQRSLEVLLSKPLPYPIFLEARVTPVLLSAAVVGGVISLAQGVAAMTFLHEGAVSIAGAVSSGLALTALSVTLLSVIVAPLLRVRDTFQGLVLAFAVWMVTVLPGVALIYRPDVYVGHEHVRDLVVVPGNMIWFDAYMPAVALVLLAVALVASRLALTLGARVLERTELR